MQQKNRIETASSRYGTSSMRTQMPISGRFSTISIRLPSHIETIRPQTRPGR